MQCEFLCAGTICILVGMISIPEVKMYGINYKKPWKIKNQLIADYFYLHAMFNLQHKFLYVGMICIPTVMIFIPAGKMCILPAGRN